MDAEVSVYTAKTGAKIAARSFRGVEPGACGENVSHLAVRGGTSGEIDVWMREVSRASLFPNRAPPDNP